MQLASFTLVMNSADHKNLAAIVGPHGTVLVERERLSATLDHLRVGLVLVADNLLPCIENHSGTIPLQRVEPLLGRLCDHFDGDDSGDGVWIEESPGARIGAQLTALDVWLSRHFADDFPVDRLQTLWGIYLQNPRAPITEILDRYVQERANPAVWGDDEQGDSVA